MSFRDWQVGDRVVCVDDSPATFGGVRPLLGKVYTISKIEADAFPELAIQVSELRYKWYEFARASRFRKVEPRKTDISVFTRFLLNPNAPVREDA